MGHKDGCLWGDKADGGFHRVPIDCVTEKQLWDSIDKLKAEKSGLEQYIVTLKAKIYDLQEEANGR